MNFMCCVHTSIVTYDEEEIQYKEQKQ